MSCALLLCVPHPLSRPSSPSNIYLSSVILHIGLCRTDKPPPRLKPRSIPSPSQRSSHISHSETLAFW